MTKKLRIAFHAAGDIPFHGNSLEERALGGTETGIIRLSEALVKKGHEVFVFTSFNNPPQTNPKYFHINELQKNGEFDVVIVVQNWRAAFSTAPGKIRLFLTGDGVEQYTTFGIGDRRFLKLYSALLSVSHWQAKMLCRYSGFPIDRTFYIGNGIHPEYFKGTETRQRNRLIYASSPDRGLSFIPDLFKKLQEKHPQLELYIYSSPKLYEGSAGSVSQLNPIMPGILAALKELKNCFYFESCLQKDLARELMKSAILFYPCRSPETCCITGLEAQAAGCAVLSSHFGALPETVSDAGLLIRGTPGSEEYLKPYLSAADVLLTDDELFNRLSKTGKERIAKHYHWDHVAERFETCVNLISNLSSV